MAEYTSICRSCFHSYVCEQFNEQGECGNKKCHFANDHFVSADEINRLQAENERLKIEKDNLIKTYSECQVANLKEFADRLKANTREFGAAKGIQREIDNLLKEMIGE